MALVNCKECGHAISSSAKACPACGAKAPRRKTFLAKLVAILLALIGVVAVVFQNQATKEAADNAAAEAARVAALTPAQRAAEQKRATEEAALEKRYDALLTLALHGANDLRKSMKDPDSFKLDSALGIASENVVCYEYHGKNSFGANVPGAAVLQVVGDKVRLVAREQDESLFVSTWNRRCAHKEGREFGYTVRLAMQ
jgi:hypothetical protein